MAKRVTKARANELLGKHATPEQIGEWLPLNRLGEQEYFRNMTMAGYTKDEAEELLRYSRY